MPRPAERPTPRVQVYFENPKVELALRREARAGRLTLSRAAEQAIARGLHKRPQADPDDRLLNLERGLRDHMRAMARDMTIVQELLMEFARAFFSRLPDSPADDDPLLAAAIEARLERLLDATAARIAAGGTPAVFDDVPRRDPQAEARLGPELRAFASRGR
ncbi:MAG: hypothetical protein GC203_08655 [Phenylobacterium sp.]|jgi:hypothetical protein|uniref:hypothetical protein n=1 Tax=Phenylobacterium sp. TaxID=1871053 RepID=UPI0025E8B346|nr:hypothetical protein [Phenylobacterium sp.]MBI1197920.1 hypothetical protein [Phenylobacterium sp.]